MFRRLETFIAACFYYSGLVKLACWWTQRSGNTLIVLCYHRAAGKYLREQMLYLSRHYRVLHLESALEELCTPPKKEPGKREHHTLLALTFDDGYSDNYTDSFALARELRTPITVFLTIDYIENGSPFRWLAGEDDHLIPYAQVSKATIEGHSYLLRKSDDRKMLKQAIDARVRYATSIAERDEFLVSVREALTVPSSTTLGEKVDLPLTWAEVHEMEESGWVSFGAHTMHHPILACLTDPAEAQYEVSECRAVLERQLGHPVRTFAYPYGLYEDIGASGLHAVKAAKYDWALTTMYGVNTPQTDQHLLRRIAVDVNQHWLVVAAKASGVWEFFLPLYRMPMTLLRSILKRNLQVRETGFQSERTARNRTGEDDYKYDSNSTEDFVYR